MCIRDRGKAPVKLTAQDGQTIYMNTCSTCHDNGNLKAPVISDKSEWTLRLEQRGFLGLTNAVIQPSYYKTLSTDCAAKRGACPDCDDAEIMAAIKYILQESGVKGNFDLW